MKLQQFSLWLFIFAVISILCFTPYHFGNAEGNSSPIIIEPIYPENQNPGTKGYFDLSVNPGDQLTLQFRIQNDGDKEVSVQMDTVNAFSSRTGGIMYEKSSDSPNAKLLDDAVQLANFMKIGESVTIPPMSAVEVPLEVTVPESDGQTILGGILFATMGDEKQEQHDAEKGKANFILKTKLVYAVAVQLNLPNSVPSHFSFGDVGFNADPGELFLEMVSDAQKIQNDISGAYAVSDENGTDLFSGKFGPFKMAPKTMIRYPIPWNYETLEDGTYNMTIQGMVAGEALQAEKSFTINKNDVEQYAENVQPIVPQAKVNKGIPSWMWIAGIVLFGVVMFFVGRRRK